MKLQWQFPGAKELTVYHDEIKVCLYSWSLTSNNMAQAHNTVKSWYNMVINNIMMN